MRTMSESSPELPPFKMETDVIPAGIDIDLAGRRSHLIQAYRRGGVDAAETYEALEHLYWSAQPTADDETRFYLRETASSFPVEATDLSEEDADRIFQEVQEKY